jgi:hypothetical protein
MVTRVPTSSSAGNKYLKAVMLVIKGGELSEVSGYD